MLKHTHTHSLTHTCLNPAREGRSITGGYIYLGTKAGKSESPSRQVDKTSVHYLYGELGDYKPSLTYQTLIS